MSNKVKKRVRKYNERKAVAQMDSINAITGAKPRVIINDPSGFSKRASAAEVDAILETQNEESKMDTTKEKVSTAFESVQSKAKNVYTLGVDNLKRAKNLAKGSFKAVVEYVKASRAVNTQLRKDVFTFNMFFVALGTISLALSGATFSFLLMYVAVQALVSLAVAEMFSLYHGVSAAKVAEIHAAH